MAFIEPDLTTQQLDDGPTDRKTQALQLLVITHLAEGVKHMRSVLWRNTLSRIRYADAHVVSIFGTSHSDNAFFGEMHGIVDSVSKYILTPSLQSGRRESTI